MRSSITQALPQSYTEFLLALTNDDFSTRVEQEFERLNTSSTRDQAINIMWTGLDPNAVTAYSTCLQTQVLSNRGLHAVVKSATATDIAVLLSWVPQGDDPSSITLDYTGRVTTDTSGRPLPRSLTQGNKIFVVGRPSAQRTLAINSRGWSDSITLEPIPLPPPPFPKPTPFAFHLTAVGFQHHPFIPIPGGQCGCGPNSIAFYENANGPNSNVADIQGRAGVPLGFRWDAAEVCRGKGIRGFPQNLGTIDFGQGTKANLPDIDGIVQVTYPDAGTYSVNVSQAATCADLHCSVSCAAQGSLQINISR